MESEVEVESSETVGRNKGLHLQQVQVLKHTEGENDMAEADMNANIEGTDNQTSDEPLVDVNSSDSGVNRDDRGSEHIPVSHNQSLACHEELVGEIVDEPSEEELVDAPSEIQEGSNAQVINETVETEQVIEESLGVVEGHCMSDSHEEGTVTEEEIVGDGEYVEDADDTPTVVVATTGEGGQYEIHMVGSQFRELTEGLPEGTQLMTEDGQLIHAVQEDEHGNMVMLANPLSEIHTVEEETGQEASEVLEGDETAEHLERDVVSEAAAEAQVSYVQQAMLEQQSEVVMLGEDVGYIVTEGESEEIIVGEAPTLEVCAETEIGTTGHHGDMAGVYTDENMLDNYMPEEGQVVVERIGYQVPVLSQNTDHDVHHHHEEYMDDEDDEIGYHEDVVISESNQTIPNFDEEANEIRMLTEAANNSLRSVEEHYAPPKKRRPRKRASAGEPGAAARKRRRPTQLYFDEQGDPLPGRARALLSGLENLNLPVATAGTAPMSPPLPPEPKLAAPQVPVPQPVLSPPPRPPQVPLDAMLHRAPPPHQQPSFLPPHQHPANLRLRNPPPRIMPELAIPQLMSAMTSPRLRSPHANSPQVIPPGMISPQMVSPRMMSPGAQQQQQQSPVGQLSPRSVSMTQKKHPRLSAMLSLTSPGAPQGLVPNVSPPSAGMVSPGNQQQMVRMPRNVTPSSFTFPPRPKIEGQQTPTRPTAPFANVSPESLRPLRPPGPQFALPASRAQLLVPPVSMQQTSQAQIQASQSHVQQSTAQQQVPRVPLPLMQNVPISRPPQLQIPGKPFNLDEYRMALQTAQLHLQNLPRFQQLISGIPALRQPVFAPPAPVNPAAAQPSETPAVNASRKVPQQSSSAPLASSAAGMQQLVSAASSISDAAIRDNNAVRDTNEQNNEDSDSGQKPKITELIKSELLAAAWESRQPRPPVSLGEKPTPADKPPVMQKPTIAATISRVEEHLRKMAEADAPKLKTEPVDRVAPPPRYSAPVSAALARPPVPTSAGLIRVPGVQSLVSTSGPVPGSTLPPISTLQTKLPPGLVPATLALASTSASVPPQMQTTPAPTTAAAVRALTAIQATGTVLASPLADDKDSRTVLPGQILVPREALRSPVSSTGLGKDPMLAGQNLSNQRPPVPVPTSDAVKSPTGSFMAGRLPTPFPLAFAPGLPPVGLMMQTPLSLPRHGTHSNHPGTSRVATSGQQHKALQSPLGGQVNPLDLIMEVMKKEMNGGAQAAATLAAHGQVPGKDPGGIRAGVTPPVSTPGKDEKPRWPTPGPTMENLIAVMQQEVAAAQIRAKVAEFHVKHAEAEAQAQKVMVNVPGSVPRPPQAPAMAVTSHPPPQGQAPRPVVPTAPQPVRSTLPPVSTVMSVNHVQAHPQHGVTGNHVPQPALSVTSPLEQRQVSMNSVPTTPTAAMQQRFMGPKSENDTLADKYMNGWEQTGRFRCKCCVYSCVTQNFLFRHWVSEHCGLKPFFCAYCGYKSPTRDGITRHQSKRHKGHPRQIVIDATQETILVQNFKALFNLDVKDVHPEDIRRESLDGLVFPEPYDPRPEKRSPGATSNGETEYLPEFNHVGMKSPGISSDKQHRLAFHATTNNNSSSNKIAQGQFEQLPPHLREHFLATSTTAPVVEENGDKNVEFLKRHHKKLVMDSSGSAGRGFNEPLSKEQLHAMAVAQAAEIDRSIALQQQQQQLQSGKSNDVQKLPSISEMRKDLTAGMGPTNANNTLPSIRDLIQMPRGQILAMAGLGMGGAVSQASHVSQTPPVQISSPPVFPQSVGIPVQHKQQQQQQQAPIRNPVPVSGQAPHMYTGSAALQEDRPHLPAGVVVPRPPPPAAHGGKLSGALPPLSSETESEAHQAAAQLVSMANSRQPVPTASNRHMTPPITEHNQQVASMVSNVAAAAEQQKAALSIEHEVAAQLEDFARRKAGQSSKSPPAATSLQPAMFGPGPNPALHSVDAQKQLSTDEQVALHMEEFRRRKAVIEAREALKPKKSPRAKSKRPNMIPGGGGVVGSGGSFFPDQRFGGSNSVDEVVAQLHHLAQKRAEDQQQQLRGGAPMPTLVPTAQQHSLQPMTTVAAAITQASQQVAVSQSTIDEQRLLATQLEELAQKRAAAIEFALRAQAAQQQQEQQQRVQQHQQQTLAAEQIDERPAHVEHQTESDSNVASVVGGATDQDPSKDTMYDVYERAVVESYANTEMSKSAEALNGGEEASVTEQDSSVHKTGESHSVLHGRLERRASGEEEQEPMQNVGMEYHAEESTITEVSDQTETTTQQGTNVEVDSEQLTANANDQYTDESMVTWHDKQTSQVLTEQSHPQDYENVNNTEGTEGIADNENTGISTPEEAAATSSETLNDSIVSTEDESTISQVEVMAEDIPEETSQNVHMVEVSESVLSTDGTVSASQVQDEFTEDVTSHRESTVQEVSSDTDGIAKTQSID